MQEVFLDEYPVEEPVTLTLTGTYLDDEGVEHEIKVTKVLDPFINPEIIITSAERDTGNPDIIYYSAEIKTNSADELEVMVEVEATDVVCASDGPFTFSSDASLNQYIIANGSAEHYTLMTMTGSYTVGGETRKVTATADIDPISLSIPPTLTITRARLNDIVDYSEAKVEFRYSVELNSASSIHMTAVLLNELNEIIAVDSEFDFTNNTDYWGTLTPSLTGTEKVLTVKVTGTYQEDGVDKTIVATRDVTITFQPDYLDTGGEVLSNPYGEGTMEAWVEFTPRDDDPHLSLYDVQLEYFLVHWYDEFDNELSYIQIPVEQFSRSTEYGGFSFICNQSIICPDDAATVRFEAYLYDVNSEKKWNALSDQIIVYYFG